MAQLRSIYSDPASVEVVRSTTSKIEFNRFMKALVATPALAGMSVGASPFARPSRPPSSLLAGADTRPSTAAGTRPSIGTLSIGRWGGWVGRYALLREWLRRFCNSSIMQLELDVAYASHQSEFSCFSKRFLLPCFNSSSFVCPFHCNTPGALPPTPPCYFLQQMAGPLTIPGARACRSRRCCARS